MKNFLLLSLLFLFQFFDSKANNLFTVSNIEIEEKSVSSSEAKQIGLDKAKKEAIQITLKKIMLSTQANDVISSISINDINDFVSEVEIFNEQASATKYKASINISFGMSLIGKYLKDRGYKFITDTPANTLMIPVAIGSDGNILTNETEKLINTINDYRQASNNIIPIMIPTNIKNFLLNAKKQDVDTIDKVNNQYNTTSAIIIRVFDFDSKTVKLDFLKTDTDSSRDITWTFSRKTDVYGTLAKLILQLSNDMYKQDIIDGKGYKGELVAVFTIKSISDILRIENMLMNIQYIDSVFIKAISQNMIQISIKTKTNKNTIIKSLNSNGFFVEDKGPYVLAK